MTFIDEAGKACLAALHYWGAEFLAADGATKAILSEMVRHIVDNWADALTVLDEFDRPAGIVSPTVIVSAIVGYVRELAKAREEQVKTNVVAKRG